MSSVFCFPWSTPSGPCSGKFLKSRILCSGCRMLCLTFIIACSALNAVSIPSLSIACHASLDCSCTAPRTTCICVRTVSLTGLRLAGRSSLQTCGSVGFRATCGAWSPALAVRPFVFVATARALPCCPCNCSCPTPWQGPQASCFRIRSGCDCAWPIGSPAFWV